MRAVSLAEVEGQAISSLTEVEGQAISLLAGIEFEVEEKLMVILAEV